ncbi:Gfo/Idh/MocA family protein [Pelagicoccus mobilis]|uniref:Gfo/Idh/MocA family oxidoreductase n=1 Tax=Pelagicoccus mobilis TaxID=415221 RepID=A0A934RUW7_9BACT|nr:Gfo/Idh/MocA family oxidoreductase [Pelagicoccus mobilis]MBK1875579.1 Gfo/Idh/MocA family oxidoreductase [Pelagicoccus mobilis]
MNKQHIRWGIIGLGRIANSFAQDIPFTTNASLQAVAARDGDKADAFAQRYGATHAYDSYNALFQDPSVDAVYIATPHSLHLEQATEAMRAGKAVLCEKPITTSPSELEQLTAIAAQTDSYLMEGMWTYFLPAVQKAKQWVDTGRIGKLLHVKSDFGYPQLPYSPDKREYNATLGGGTLLEMGIYPIALARLFFGEDPINVDQQSHLAPNGVEDDTTTLFTYPGDRYANLASSFRCKLQNWTYIIGEDGYIAIPDTWRANRCLLYELDTLVDEFDDKRESLGFHYEVEAVSQDILEGKKTSKIVPHSTSMAFQLQIEQLRKMAGSLQPCSAAL